MFIRTGPTGKVIRGHVLDVSVKPFERALKDYDSLLYVKWNPKKLNGWGTWEVRRRPEKKSVVDFAEWDNKLFLKLDYHEIDIINHVMDAPYLNYSVLTKIQSIDTWKDPNWVENMLYAEKRHQVTTEAKQTKELRYNLKQFKSIFKEYKEMVLSGHSPAGIIPFM